MFRLPPRLFIVGCLLPGLAVAAEVIEDPAEHAALMADQPSVGVAFTVGFESDQIGSLLSTQYASEGLHLYSPIGPYVLPSAFGTVGVGSRLAVVGYDPLEESSLTLLFVEPQLVMSAQFVDVEGGLLVEAFYDDAPVEAFELPASEAPPPGGVFRAIWFSGFVDEVTFHSDMAEDGFGLDQLSAAVLGTVDNDGDGWSDADGDCDDSDPTISPADLCGGFDLDCDGEADDADEDGATACDGDCDDTDDAVGPGGTEVCNGVDDDCDGLVDESADGDGDGWTLCEGDCDDSDSDVFPGQGCDDIVDDDDIGPDDDDDTSDDDDDDDTSDDDDDDDDDDDTSDDDDDDTSGSDDDDDDTSSDDDVDDDDGVMPPGAEVLPGITGGGCGCEATGRGQGGSLLLLLVLAGQIRRRAR